MLLRAQTDLTSFMMAVLAVALWNLRKVFEQLYGRGL
jgi:hypothetical protein